MHPLHTIAISTTTTTIIIVVMAASFLASNATGFAGGGDPTGVVYPGGCYLQSELIRCALDQSHCEGLVFRSSRQMKEMQMFGEEEEGNDDADRCRRPHPDYVGMCTSGIDKYHCTGHESGCVIASKFVPNIPYCTIRHNHFPGRDTHLALYGSCTSIDESTGEVTRTCVWSIDDCPGAGIDPAITYFPSSFSSIDDEDAPPPCTCDLVKTGACVLESEEWDTGDWTCAVSADACDRESSFRTRKQVEESGRDCRLCDVFDKTVVVSTGRVHSWRTTDHDHHHHHSSSSSTSTSSSPATAAAAGADDDNDDDFHYHLEYDHDHDHDHSHADDDDDDHDHDHDHSYADDDNDDDFDYHLEYDHDHDHSHADDDDHDHDHSHAGVASAFLNSGGDTCQAGIVAASAVGSVLIVLLVTLIALVLCRDNNNNNNSKNGRGGVQRKDAADADAPDRNGAEEGEEGEMVVVAAAAEKGGTMA